MADKKNTGKAIKSKINNELDRLVDYIESLEDDLISYKYTVRNLTAENERLAAHIEALKQELSTKGA